MSDTDGTATHKPTPLAWLLRATALIRSDDPAERAEALDRLRNDGWPVADGMLMTLERALDGMTAQAEVTLRQDELSALAAPLAVARTILAAWALGESAARLESGLAARAPA